MCKKCVKLKAALKDAKDQRDKTVAKKNAQKRLSEIKQDSPPTRKFRPRGAPFYFGNKKGRKRCKTSKHLTNT